MPTNTLTTSLGRNIITVEGNGLAIFVDDTDSVLKLKDVDGNIQPVSDYVGTSGGGGIQSINALTASAQFLNTGTSGTDFAVQSSGNTHTFNLPNASETARGVVSTAAQTFKGVKTFTDN
jgi:hypothetical protein